MKIPIDEIAMEPTSGADDAGCVFRWNGDVYRGIFKADSDLYKKIFLGPLGENLIRSGVVPTEVSSLRIDGFDLVLKHKAIPFVSYAEEWSIGMLKDAALLVCDIQGRLLRSGYTLKDAHQFNVLFDACTPKFVDVGSIAEISSTRLDYFLEEFRSSFLYPLLLKRAGLSAMVNASLLVNLCVPGFSILRILLMLLPMREWIYHYLQRNKINKVWRSSPITGLQYLREEVEAIGEGIRRTEWSDYHSSDGLIDRPQYKSAKISALVELINRERPQSVLDIGASNGFYSKLAAQRGARVIAADIDELNINGLYHEGKAQSLDILPICIDICTPVKAHGPWNILKSSEERFRSEMVMMLALVHHLIQKRCATFNDIAKTLSLFSKKTALVEFIGRKDEHVASWARIQNAGHNLDNFMKVLGQYFCKVDLYRQLNDDRWLILCGHE